jgi:hypothetical protein
MFNLLNRFGLFTQGISYSVVEIKKRRKIPAANITVLVDGSTQNSTAIFSVP